MKLKQNEYCHNCNQYVDFEFEDTTRKQVIICPNCGHEHWREIDEGTLLNIKIDPRCRVVRIAKMKSTIPTFIQDPENPNFLMPEPEELEYDEREVIGNTNEGAVVKTREGDTNIKRTISDRRWGQDPSQGG